MTNFTTYFPIVALVGSLVCGLCILIGIINIILRRNILVPTLEEKLNSRLKEQKLNKSFLDYYKNLVNSFIIFKKKVGLFFASKYAIEHKNIIFERTFTKLIPTSMTYKNYYEDSAENTIFSLVLAVLCLLAYLVNVIFVKNLLFNIGVLVVLVGGLLYINVIKFLVLELEVKAQNDILERNFNDFFLCQYHILMTEHKNPLTKGLNIYKFKVTDPYMQKWTENTLQQISNSAEEIVIDRYLMLYKDVTTLFNLLNIEKQLVNGGDCELQLTGLREQIIQKKTIAIEDNAAAVVTKAILLRNIVFVIVFQVMAGAVVWFMLNNMGK